jgi:cholesterol transport system auxiliary component
MRDARFALPACAAVALVACSIGKPIPAPNTYVVQPPAPESNSSVATNRESLRVGNVRVAAAYAGTSLVYRMDEVRFTSDPYSRFIAEPATMLGDQMATWLAGTERFEVVGPESALPTHYLLETTVTELYGDFRSGPEPAAVLAVQFALLDQRGARPKAVFERSIARRVDLPRASPDALVRGYGDALAQILTELSTDLQIVGK